MPTSYPGGIDNFTDPTANDTMDGAVGGPTVFHDVQHAELNDAVKAVQTTIGTTGGGPGTAIETILNGRYASLSSWGAVVTPPIPNGAAENTAVGPDASFSAIDAVMPAITTGTANLAVGLAAANLLTSGVNNTMLGQGAGRYQTTGSANTFVGTDAGAKPANVIAHATVTGSHNTFIGQTCGCNSTGDYSTCTAIGDGALVGGAGATSVGQGAVAGGSGSTSIGTSSSAAGVSATVVGATASAAGLDAVAVGYGAAAAGQQCTAIGENATTGASPVASTAVGSGANASGNPGTALGYGAQATGNGSVAIGIDSSYGSATTAVANEIRLGTANHHTCIPGVPAFATGDKYVVITAGGILHVSSLGPAS